jgi:hypothetical protein
LINDNTSSFNSDITISDSFNIKLIPHETGTTSFNVEVVKNGISNNITINLISNVPEFVLTNTDINETLSDIWSDDIIHIDTDIYTTYDHNINYTYVSGIENINSLSTSVNGNPPNTQTLPINIDGNIGDFVAFLTVENQYGYSQTYTKSFTSKDMMFTFNELRLLNKLNPNSDSNVARFYDNLRYQTNIVKQKYDISTVEFIVSAINSTTLLENTFSNSYDNSNIYTNNCKLTRGYSGEGGKNYYTQSTVFYGYDNDGNPVYVTTNTFYFKISDGSNNIISIYDPTESNNNNTLLFTIKVTDVNGNVLSKSFNNVNTWNTTYYGN